MATPKESSKQAARLALRLQRRTQNHLSTSYRESGGESSSPAQETPIQNPQSEIGNRLSWLDLPDDRWPSDYWRVGADLRPDLWPVLWTFLLEGGE
jgi:hypothetical protein